ncbi:MAG TPA: Uma2 family endonuclease [Candidatus Limnocylindrales bacterium]
MREYWTEQDLAELPQDGTRYEIVDGRLYVTPPAGESHQRPALHMAAVLLAAAPPGWRVLYEIGLRVGEDRVIPDLIVLPPGTPVADHDYNDVTVIKPALVVEVASKSTETIDRGNKMVVYAEGGIPSYWRVTRDGLVHMHRLMEKGEYGLLATVKPGEPHEVLWPFPFTLDAAKLRST